MIFILVIAVVLIAGGFLAALLLRADPAVVARNLRMIPVVVLGLFGIVMTLIGRANIGMMALSAAGGLYTLMRRMAPVRRDPNRHSTVRSAALEMTLDHDTGHMEGMVLAGRFEGRALGEMDLEELRTLLGELAYDADGLRLLEAYLDGRFAGWRDDGDAHADRGLGGAPASGAMSEQEAYEILGLEPGASEAEIREAHRRLMQRVHPDLGGSSFLAARINQAKALLLGKR